MANSNFIDVTPTIQAAAYATGNCLGGMLTFAKVIESGVYGAQIHSARLLDQDGQNVEIELWLFNAVFTSNGDKVAWNPSAADMVNLVGIIDFAAADYAVSGGPSECYEGNLCVPITVDSSQNLYGQLVVRGAPTYTGVGRVTVGINKPRT